MDPWSGIQAASAVLSFVTFAGSLLSGAYKVYTGSSQTGPSGQDMRLIAQSLKSLRSDITRGLPLKLPELPESDVKINDMCQACEEIANSLVAAIESICGHGDGKPTFWDSFRQSLRSIWNKEKIDDLQRRLESLQTQIQVLLNAAVR